MCIVDVANSVLAVVFFHFELCDPSLQTFASETCIQMAGSLGAQLWWRFTRLKEFPYLLIGMHDKRWTVEEQTNIADSFWNSCKWCRDAQFSDKLHDFYPDAESMRRCPHLRHGLSILASNTPLANMLVERLLALIKQSCVGETTPHLEREVANGFLTQWLAAFKGNGGADPRVQTRSQMVNAGLPTKANKRRSSRGGMRGWMVYQNEAIEKVDPLQASHTKGARDRIKKSARARYRSGALPEEEVRRCEMAVAQFTAKAQAKRVAGQEDAQTTEPYLWNLSSNEFPLAYDEFAASVAELLGVSQEEAERRGFSSYAPRVRDQARASMFVTDRGAIPPGAKYAKKRTCWECHPGLCRGKHEAVYGSSLELGDALIAVLSEEAWLFKWCRVRHRREGDEGEIVRSELFYISNTRYSQPELVGYTCDSERRYHRLVHQ